MGQKASTAWSLRCGDKQKMKSRDGVTLKISDSEGLIRVMSQVWELAARGLKGGPVVISLGREKRSLDQNAKMWPMLGDVSKQVEWHGQHLSPEDWKHVFSAAQNQQRAVPGIDGGFVVLGQSTSRLDRSRFAELIEIIYAFGAEQGVAWTEPALRAYEQYRAAS